MVKAFFIHTLLPGRGTILYSRWYGAPMSAVGTSELYTTNYNTSTTPDTISLSSRLTLDPERISIASSVIQEDSGSFATSDTTAPPLHKQVLVNLSKEVQAQYAFKSSVSGRSYEQDIQRLNTDGVIPDLEQGYFRHSFEPEEVIDANIAKQNVDEKVVLWMGALNTGFCLVCHKNENRLLAEKLLKLWIKNLQEHCRVFNHPTEILTKPDRVSMVIDQLLPSGTLLFLTHRAIRQFEKELERKLKAV